MTDSTIPSILQNSFTCKQQKGNKPWKTGCEFKSLVVAFWPFQCEPVNFKWIPNTLEGDVFLLSKIIGM